MRFGCLSFCAGNSKTIAQIVLICLKSRSGSGFGLQDLYWLLVLQTELAAYLYLLSHRPTGTQYCWNPGSYRVDIVRPVRAYIIPLFAVCLCSCVCIVMCTLSTPRVGGVCSRRMHI